MKFDTVMFPIDTMILGKYLKDENFTPINPSAYTTKDGIKAQQGDVAVKGNILVNISEVGLQISVIGKKPVDLSDTFDSLVIACENTGTKIESTTKFFEFEAELLAETGNNALEKIQKFLSPVNLEKINKITGINSALFSIRFGSDPLEVNSEEFYEIKIEPHLRNFSRYYITTVFRSKQRKKPQDFLKHFDEKISEILDVIENP